MIDLPAATRTQASGRQRGWIGIGALIAVLVFVRSAISASGYLVGDDYAVRYRAAVQPWSLDYAFEPYNDHISPIGYSLQWLLQWAFPGSHLALVGATSVLMTLTLVCMAAFIWVLTHRAIAMVVATVTLGLGLLTFEVGTWWCVSLYSMTYLAFASWALLALARSLRFGAPTTIVLLALSGAVLSDSKGFLVLLLLYGVAAGIGARRSGPLGLRASWQHMPVVWSAGLVLSAAMAGLTAWTTSGVQGTVSVDRSLPMMWDLWAVNIAPAVWGGPWWWSEVPAQTWSPVRVLPATPIAVGVACLLACLAGTVYVLRRRPQIAGFVPWAILYALATTALPVLARSGTNLASPAYRYTFDVVLPVAIILTLALVPLWWQTGRPARALKPLMLALAVSMIVSTVVPAQAWRSNEAEAYVEKAVGGFSSIPAGQSVIPQAVPEDLVPGLLWQYANTEAVFAPQPGAPDFAQTTRGVLYGFAPDGSVQVQDVAGPTSPEGPDPDCGYRVGDVARQIPLDGELIAWQFLARVAYFSGVDTTLNLAVGGQIHTVPLPAGGLDAVYFPVDGPGEEVLVSVGTPGATVCVTEVRIGNRVDPATDTIVGMPLRELPQ